MLVVDEGCVELKDEHLFVFECSIMFKGDSHIALQLHRLVFLIPLVIRYFPSPVSNWRLSVFRSSITIGEHELPSKCMAAEDFEIGAATIELDVRRTTEANFVQHERSR